MSGRGILNCPPTLAQLSPIVMLRSEPTWLQVQNLHFYGNKISLDSLGHLYINGSSICPLFHPYITNGENMFPLFEVGHVTTIAAPHWSIGGVVWEGAM